MSDLKPVIAVITLLGLPAAFAGEHVNSPTPKTGTNESSTTTSRLSETEHARAKHWALSATEWQRYQSLMQGIRGSISPATISPIEVLGIHARDEAERRRYAELWAQAMRDDVDRILAFQHAYDAAMKRLSPDEPLIDVHRLPRQTDENAQYLETDRLLFFATTECPACDALVAKLLGRIDAVGGIDIYLVGLDANDDTAVRAWASTHHIDPEWVRSRRVTLNHDGGALAKLTVGKGGVPMVFHRRGEHVAPIDLSAL